MKRTIFVGADHRGAELKAKIIDALARLGHDVVNVGANDPAVPCDYPPIAFEVAKNVATQKKSRGILICMSGIGHSIAANKVRGAYAALCYNEEAAVLSRQHNDANILILGSRFVPESSILNIITSWLDAEFEGGRHLRRVRQIKAMEDKVFKKSR